MDTGYTTLLNLLQRPNNTLSTLKDETIHGAVAHYLSVLPVIQLPNFVRAMIASPTLWRSRKWDHLCGIQAAVRQSVRMKHTNTAKVAVPGFLFDADIGTPFKEWLSAILQGQSIATSSLQHLYVGVAVLGGLLQGLEDIVAELAMTRMRKKINDELVKTSTVLLDQIQTLQKTVWAADFESEFSGEESSSTLSICILATNAVYIPDDDLKRQHSRLLATSILIGYKRVFGSGILTGLDEFSSNSEGEYHLPHDPKLARDLANLNRSVVYRSLGPLSQLFSRCIRRLSEVDKTIAWVLIMQTTDVLSPLSASIEAQWASSEISAITDEQRLESKSRATMITLWQMLKAYLFSTVLMSQSIVDVITFHHPPKKTVGGLDPASSPQVASSLLLTLSHAAFISSKFGGITSEGGGFKEQKRLFFSSLDILCSDPVASEALLKVLEGRIGNLPPSHPVEHSRSAFFLACAEQLIPIANSGTLDSIILPFAKKFLSKLEQREVFESAHSVMLSVFAKHSNKSLGAAEDNKTRLASRLVPFYLESLLENASEGHLSIEQLRLAYHSLVRSSSASTDDASAWFCIEALLTALQDTRDASERDKHKRLALTLVSLISAVNLTLLKPVLAAIETELLWKDMGPEDRKEISKEVHDQIMGRIGDAQKEVALKWWLDLRERLSFEMGKQIEVA
ncbi:uncharacterized protein EI90DRAFT_3036454 [Cantharellus anzutake]|uniref:uncharacterized protein n=1 Tax=Cantharellus anzutake TaxID=1750568 RepID=UPI0019076574|nr:uncharacterized protein EI90DRAFT_3036454 [Cantharellus anzutake]KAF8340678.1 hypothetical protein EI90DRAFT_3036454 [Cantharellus anzutake]